MTISWKVLSQSLLLLLLLLLPPELYQSTASHLIFLLLLLLLLVLSRLPLGWQHMHQPPLEVTHVQPPAAAARRHEGNRQVTI
jgi:predicted ABC-type exoprotein transport system permease subunit